MTTRTCVMAVTLLATLGIGLMVVRAFACHVLPVSWSDEPKRLAALLALGRGQHVAEIGAGDGAMAVEMARVIGSEGVLYATELGEAKRVALERRVRALPLPQVRVVAGAVDATNLPEASCDALYMRMVFHHIERPADFAREIARAVRPGGRVAVIDFAPGALFFLGPNHGVRPDVVVDAFERAGLPLVQRGDDWGGGTFMLVFGRR